jgi:hypothetical protein
VTARERQRPERRRFDVHRDDAEKADELGLTPLARLVSWGVAGVAPNIMGIGPVPATEGSARQGGACGSPTSTSSSSTRRSPRQALAVMREWGFTAPTRADERARVGISLGHPGRGHRRPDARHAARVNCTGARRRTGWRPCASAAGRALPRCSKGLVHDQTRQTLGLTEFQTEIVSNVAAIRRQGDHPQRQEPRALRHLPAGHRRPDAGNGAVRPDDSRGIRRP